MANNTLGKICDFFRTGFSKLKANAKRGAEWLGVSGLANLESSALFVIFLRLFFPMCVSMIASFLIVTGKCIFDERRGSEHEKHDFICSVIGVIVGAILSMAYIALVI